MFTIVFDVVSLCMADQLAVGRAAPVFSAIAGLLIQATTFVYRSLLPLFIVLKNLAF
jgi:hypothetical protein